MNINTEKGISLVETIVYIAIFSMFVVSLASFSTTLSTTRLHTQGVLEVNEQGSQILRLITQTIRNADGVNSPSISASSATLSIETGVPATNPTTFYASGGVLYITEGSGSAVALTNNKISVSNLSFTNLSRPGTPNIVRVAFTVTNVSARDPFTANFGGSGAIRK